MTISGFSGSASSPVRLGVLLSGRGSNFQAIWSAITDGQIAGAEVALVASNRADAPGLTTATDYGLRTAAFPRADYPNRDAADVAMCQALQAAGVDLVILAGYDRIVSAAFLAAFAHRVLNIHPSLLPAYGGPGMVGHRVHEAVIAAGELESGCTVHTVIEAVDAGPILGQHRITIAPNDTPDTLAQKVLAEEHRLYPIVIAEIVARLRGTGGQSAASERQSGQSFSSEATAARRPE